MVASENVDIEVFYTWCKDLSVSSETQNNEETHVLYST